MKNEGIAKKHLMCDLINFLVDYLITKIMKIWSEKNTYFDDKNRFC